MFPFVSGFGVMEPFPSAPVVVSAVPTVGSESSSVTVTWTDYSSLVRWHRLEKKLSGGSWVAVSASWTGGSPYIFTGLSDNSLYYFRLNARNLSPTSGYSNEGSATTEYAPVTQAPSWWSGYPKDDPADGVSTLIRLTSAVPNATAHKVYWKKNSPLTGDPPTNADGSFDWPGGVVTTEYDHTEAGWGVGDVIYYAVNGYNPDSVGPCLYGNTTIAVAAPTAPSGVSASVVGTDIRIVWTDNSSNEDNFNIEYITRVCGGSFPAWTSSSTILPDPVAEAEQYDWSGATEGNEYLFRVNAENAGGVSAWATMVEPNEVTYSFTPGAPTWTSTYPKVDPADPDDDVDLSWANSGTGTIDDTEIHRSDSSGFTPAPGTLLQTVAVGTTTYNDDGLGGALAACAAPSVTAVASDQLNVDWDDIPDADTYTLHRDPSNSGFTPTGTTAGVGNCIYAGAAIAHNDDGGGAGLDPNEDYYYKVIGYQTTGETFYYKLVHINDCGETGTTSAQGSVTLTAALSPASVAGSGTTWPGAPLSLDVTLDDTNCPTEEADLTWDNGGNTTGTLTVRWSDISSSGGWTTLSSSVAAGTETYHHSTPTEGDNWYEVKFNSGGDGTWAAKYKILVCPA